MPVALIIPILAFFGALKAHQLGLVNWVFGALFAVLFPFIINDIVVQLILSKGAFSMGATFPPSTIATLALQLAGALFIFRFVETHEDSISTWIVTAIIGYIALYVAIPYLVGLVLQ